MTKIGLKKSQSKISMSKIKEKNLKNQIETISLTDMIEILKMTDIGIKKVIISKVIEIPPRNQNIMILLKRIQSLNLHLNPLSSHPKTQILLKANPQNPKSSLSLKE